MSKAASEYREKLKGAINFAKDTEGETWDCLFLMGLAIAGLDTIPIENIQDTKSYWTRMPSPKSEVHHWTPSYIVERDFYEDVLK